MARTTRSISAKQRARNERYQAYSGGLYKNEYQFRKAMRAGEIPAVAPDRLSSKKSIKAQTKKRSGGGFYDANLVASKTRPKTGPKKTFAQMADECQAWSDRNAATTVFKYDIGLVPVRHSRAKNEWALRTDATAYYKQAWIQAHSIEEYTDVYHTAFVLQGDLETGRSAEGSAALEKWLVEITQYEQADEYESRYGPN